MQQQNQHPSVMFEIIARDQDKLKQFYQRVFGWHYDVGTGGFAYVTFPERSMALLGGVGRADPQLPGFEPGHNFYFLVDDLEATLRSVEQAGGSRLMPPSRVDGYEFAMFKDPEENPVGIIKPFRAGPPSTTGDTRA